MTTRATRSQKAHPRVQLTEEHASRLQLPPVDEGSPDVTEVVFPNGRVNCVLLARRTSKTRALRSLHEHLVESAGPRLDRFLSELPDGRLVRDGTAGGRYVASGFGTMGKSLPRSVRPPGQPALRQCLRSREHMTLAEIVGGVFSRVAECVSQHCRSVHEDNQLLMETSPGMVWPPLRLQKPGRTWASSQFVVRRWGGNRGAGWPLERETVAAHADLGDLDTTMFHLYTTGGGTRAGAGQWLGRTSLSSRTAQGALGIV